MKKEDIDKSQEGELEKVTGFQYVQGSICRLSPDDDEPVSILELKKSFEKGAVICPRCDGPMEVRPDGMWCCPADGLVLTDEVQKKLGIKS